MSSTLDANTAQLLIIDVQERLAPAMYDREGAIKACAILLEGARILQIPATLSEQYPKGLGHTVEELLAHKDGIDIFEKIHFSCMRDDAINTHLTGLKSSGRSQLIIGGIEAHICVLQTALEAIEAGFDTYIVSDAINARTKKSQKLAEKRLQAKGASIITTEMALFECLGKAGSPEFKSISKLIK